MVHTKSESDVTSLAPSSPSRSSKRPVYFVHSPSRDSRDGDKTSSMHATSIFTNPLESMSHRFSWIFGSSSGRKWGRKRNDEDWPKCNLITEEGTDDEFDEEEAAIRRCRLVMVFLGVVVLFTVFCLIMWGAGRPFKAQVSVRSFTVNNVYAGSMSDRTGVPTKVLHVNGTLRINVYNPATFFGIYVSATPVNLLCSDVVVATGELNKYFQPKKSHHIVLVHIQGDKVPLYGAGLALVVAENSAFMVPLTIEFEIRSQGHVVGKLVRVKHRRRVSCKLEINSANTKPIPFKQGSCTYN